MVGMSDRQATSPLYNCCESQGVSLGLASEINNVRQLLTSPGGAAKSL